MTTRPSTSLLSVRRRGPRWPIPAALILLSLIPVIAGAARLTELTGGAAITPQNARFFASPVPVVIHIVSVTIYSLLGAFQFVPALRGRRGWHRVAGAILIPAGLLAAFSGLWMSTFYPLPDGTADVPIRIFFGSAMLVSLMLGIDAIRRRDFVRHDAWMTRGYAIGVAAGTQAVVISAWLLLVGTPDEWTKALLMAAAWGINLAVAESVIRRRARASGRTVRSAGRPVRTGADRRGNLAMKAAAPSECLNSTSECPPVRLAP